MSDKTEKQTDDEGGWVPSAEQPVPPTTEFAAVKPEGVEPISGSLEPDEDPAVPTLDGAPTTGSAPQASDEPAAAASSDDAPTTTGSGPQADASTSDATTSHPIVTPKPAPMTDAGSGTATPAGSTAPTSGTPSVAETPAWKTPPAVGLPPQWGDPAAKAAAATTGPEPTNDISNLWGLAPEDRPEVLLGAALAGGVLTAILLRTVARR